MATTTLNIINNILKTSKKAINSYKITFKISSPVKSPQKLKMVNFHTLKQKHNSLN